MWTGMLWFALLAAAMLCYPGRPRTAGTLWIMLGVLSVALKFAREAGVGFGPISGLFMIGMGSGIWSSPATLTFERSTSNTGPRRRNNNQRLR